MSDDFTPGMLKDIEEHQFALTVRWRKNGYPRGNPRAKQSGARMLGTRPLRGGDRQVTQWKDAPPNPNYQEFDKEASDE